MQALSSRQSENLSRRFRDRLANAPLRLPRDGETEPSFTKYELAPLVRSELDRLPRLPLDLRGDGGGETAVPARALGESFYPDLAVSLGGQHIWAAEVKFLRAVGRQGSLVAAIGQATLYKGRYEHVTVVLIDMSPPARELRLGLVEQGPAVGMTFVIRARLGKALQPSS